MMQTAKNPDFWGDDLNGVQINPNPSDDAPVTVTDSSALAQPAPDLGAGPDPAYYARLGRWLGS